MTITGTNFINVTSVTIGGVEIGGRTIVSSTQITGTTPIALSPSARDVVVTSGSNGRATCGGCFSYYQSGPDFILDGTVPASGPPPFLHFTAPRAGNLTASVTWSIAQTTQTVCAGRSDIADLPATCAPSVSGTTNTVTIGVSVGNQYVVYAVPDYTGAVSFGIAVTIR